MKRKAALPLRPYCWSLGSAFLWIILIVLILLCHLSSETVNARVLVVRRRNGENAEGLNDNDMLQKPGHHKGQLAFDETHVSDFDRITLHKNELVDGAYTRDKRGAFALDRRRNIGVKHVQRIPNSNGNGPNNKNRPAPEPEESSDETFESLEANREAFLDILAENAKHRHRKRPTKKHGSKMHLKFNEKLQRWTLTEEQSDEWVI